MQTSSFAEQPKPPLSEYENTRYIKKEVPNREPLFYSFSVSATRLARAD